MKKTFESPHYYFGAKTVLRRLIDRSRHDHDIISKNDLVLAIYEELEDIEFEYNQQQKSLLTKDKESN